MKLPDGWLFTPRWDSKDLTKIVVEQTEIVRCKNCRYYETDFWVDGHGWCSLRGHGSSDEWYCADGEAKTDADD